MRASVIVPLILAALFGFGLRASSMRTPRQHGERAIASSPGSKKSESRLEVKKPLWAAKVTGLPHQTEKDAIESALREAGLKMSEEFLKKRNPRVDWVPTAEFLRQDKLKAFNVDRIESQTLKDFGDRTMQTAIVDVEINDSALKEIQEQDRHYRMEQRLWLLGRGLGGIVLVLGAIAGAIRLDEWTKGYFPWPLKMGVVALAGVGAAALWFVQIS